MILYHASTMYQLLYCAAHKMTAHEGESCRLLLLESIAPTQERAGFLDRLRAQNWFDWVDYVPESRLQFNRGRALNEGSGPGRIEAAARKISRGFQAWLREDLRAYEKIYVASDQWSLGVTLLYNKIPYAYMEDAGGMLSEEGRYLRITKGFNRTNYSISQHYGGAGRSDIVTEKLCDLRCQQPGFRDPKAVDFSIYRALTRDIPHRVPEFLSFYSVEPIAAREGGPACLFLTQFIKTMADRSLDTQERITTLLVDYLCPDHALIIKPHPKDRYLNYRRMFPGALALPNRFPAELLPFALGGPLDAALTASSTSIGGLAPYTRKCYSFGTEIEAHWERLHLMAAAARVLQGLGVTGAAVRRVNEAQMRNLLDAHGIGAGREALIDGGLPGYDEAGADAPLTLRLHFEGSTHDLAASDARVGVKLIPQLGSLLRPANFTITARCAEEAMRARLWEIDEKIELKYSKAVLEIKSE